MISDKHFHVEVCPLGSSPSPEASIWDFQHFSVSEGGVNFNLPKDPSKAVIKHQLKVQHWSVLNGAFVKLRCFGYPHNTIAQMTRHRDSTFLVQSFRYTGQRIVEACKTGEVSDEDAESIIYLRPVGTYKDRNSPSYEYTEGKRMRDLKIVKYLLLIYAENVKEGMPYEQARGLLPYDYRQDFSMTGTLQDVYHWLDQRTKKDAQLEVQTFAAQALNVLKQWSPNLMEWYELNRATKANLAP